ncbi:MAG: multiheme c-type cytochrome [Gemmataceae bacterium]
MMRAWASVAVVLVAGIGTMAVFSNEPGDVPPAGAQAAPTVISTSISECKICHSGPTVGLRDYTEKFGSDKFIKLTESLDWEQNDPHSVPFAQHMKSDLGKKMLAKYPNATTNAACLTCHAVDTHQAKDRFAGVESNGIGCSGCHGLVKEWQSKHYESQTGEKVDWREWSVEKKSAAGMKNLRDPAIKANLCVSCHVGSPSEGKVITHDMYAAGHPPLPPFELLTFMDGEPKHWGTPFDESLSYFHSLDAKKARELFSYHKSEGASGYAARHVAAGAIAALRAEVSLHAAEAKALPAHAGLDYARFDCYACHHDLKIPSDRQSRGYDGPPGRPPVKAWVGTMASVVAEHLGEKRKSEFAKLWSELKVEMYSKPYGNPLTVGPKAEQIVAWCNDVEKELAASKAFEGEGARKLHARIAATARDVKVAADPEAVMSLVWAYRGLSKSMGATESLDSLKPYLPLTVREASSRIVNERVVPVTAGEATGPRMKTFVNYSAAEFLKRFPK